MNKRTMKGSVIKFSINISINIWFYFISYCPVSTLCSVNVRLETISQNVLKDLSPSCGQTETAFPAGVTMVMFV